MHQRSGPAVDTTVRQISDDKAKHYGETRCMSRRQLNYAAHNAPSSKNSVRMIRRAIGLLPPVALDEMLLPGGPVPTVATAVWDACCCCCWWCR